ncbi:hypothetical protein MKW92_045722 [Papaver armeniacum]|nr:hypothetical protein MKW92_045722 [Papaver armeniacum]
MNMDKLMKMAGAVLAGGKGSRVGVNVIPVVEKVNIFKDDSVIQFLNPKGSVAANTWIVNGFPHTKKLQDIILGIINQLACIEFKKELAVAITVAATQEDDDDDVHP